MADFESIADKATQYVFGELSPGERQEFETLLEQLPELRAHVRELQEGALALAAASTPATPPKTVWREIERTVAHDQKQKRIHGIITGLFRNGWAAAAACVIGWIVYALWGYRSLSNSSGTNAVAAAASSLENQRDSRINFDANSSTDANRSGPIASTTSSQTPDLTNRETMMLKHQLAGMQEQILQLSNSLGQYQAALNEPSRMKFFQLEPATGVEKPVISPALERAFFYALARELGWLSNTNYERDFNAPIFSDDAASTNRPNMDFVDLRTNSVPKTFSPPASTKELAQNSDTPPANDTPAPTATPASTVIPAFASKDSLFVAIDPSMAQPQTQVTLTSGSSGQLFGTATMGNVPLVIATPWSGAQSDGAVLTITFLSTAGGTNAFNSSVFVRAPGP
jgi:hypothetical protein